MSITSHTASWIGLPQLPKISQSKKFDPEKAMLCRNKVRRSSQFLNELIQSKPIAKRLEQIMDKESESKNKIHYRRIKIYGKKLWDSSIQIKSKPLKKISSDWIKLGKRSNKKAIPMLSNVIDLLAPNKLGGSCSKIKEMYRIL